MEDIVMSTASDVDGVVFEEVKTKDLVKNKLKEYYEYRFILRSLIVRNLFGRYKSSALGFAWHFINPLIMIFVYYVVFGKFLANNIETFWIYLAVAMYPFMFLSGNLSGGAGCVVDNAEMVNKMYFPRSYLVLAQIISTFVIMVLGYVLILAIILMTGYHIPPINYLYLVPIFGLLFLYSTGYVLLFSSITVYVKDIRYFLAAVEIIFYFVTPLFVIIGSAGVPESLNSIFWLNPFTYFIESFHSLMYFGTVPGMDIWGMCAILAFAHIIVGSIIFHLLSDGFTERI